MCRVAVFLCPIYRHTHMSSNSQLLSAPFTLLFVFYIWVAPLSFRITSLIWRYHSPVTVKQFSLQWRHNERNGVSNHRRLDYLLNRFFKHRSNKTSKLRVTGLCEGNSPVTGEVPTQSASDAENVSIWWRHQVKTMGEQMTWIRKEMWRNQNNKVQIMCILFVIYW